VSLQDESIFTELDEESPQRRTVSIVRDRTDWIALIIAAVASLAAVIAAGGAIWAAKAATGALSEAQHQTRILSDAAIAQEQAAALDRQAPLVLRCLVPSGPVDATWSITDSSNNFDERPSTPSGTPSQRFTCSITNFGRVPALLVLLPFKVMRTRLGLCDLMQDFINGEEGFSVYRRLQHVVNLPIPGIAAGATYRIAVVDNSTDEWLFIDQPDTARYMTPAETKPTDKPLIGRKAPGFPYWGSMPMQPIDTKLNARANACFTQLSKFLNSAQGNR